MITINEEILAGLSLPVLMLMVRDLEFVQKDQESDQYQEVISQIKIMISEKNWSIKEGRPDKGRPSFFGTFDLWRHKL